MMVIALIVAVVVLFLTNLGLIVFYTSRKKKESHEGNDEGKTPLPANKSGSGTAGELRHLCHLDCGLIY